jgi:A/G-specific adenine glycosylase
MKAVILRECYRMSFAQKLVAWQRRHGRKGLPWQGTRDPYRIWLSEVMLQQTQVSSVIPYYERFLKAFPDVNSLARSDEEEVLRLWSGLGYYARGRNLHAAAMEIARSGFPGCAAEIEKLPGIGRSTAAAIAAFAYGERAAILDGNVKRVLSRCFAVNGDLWPLAERLLPKKGMARYTQALMDLGATVCTRKPRCEACPVSGMCVARKTKRIAQFPPRKAKPAVPQRSTTWLVLRHGGEVLLQKRPADGIWGGLWCFPQASGKVKGTKLAPIEHGFTHFRLRIHPVLREVRAKTGNGLWMDIADAQGAAVPAPVRRLLSRLSAMHSPVKDARARP